MKQFFVAASIIFISGALSGCAGLTDLRGTIERFPLGTVLDAAQAVYCAVSKCDTPSVPAPAPEVKP